MNTKNKIKTILSLTIVAMVIGPMTATLQASNLFSINFYYLKEEGMPGGYWPDDQEHTIMLSERETAGYGIWEAKNWANIFVPWGDFVPTPIEGESSQEDSVSFTLVEKRNGWAINEDPVEVGPGTGNFQMMNAAVQGTEWGPQNGPDPENPLENNWIDILVEDIPLGSYDVIVYLTSHITYDPEDDETIAGTKTGKFIFNGGEVMDIEILAPPFDGRFVTTADADPNGINYLLFEDVTGDSFTIQMYGNEWSHMGICGLQFGNYDPNTPDVDAGPDMIAMSGMPVPVDADVVNNDTFEPQRDLYLEWTATPATGVVFSPSKFVANPTITITDPDSDEPTIYKLSLATELVNPSAPNEAPGRNSMNIEVYSDACKAKVAAGLAWPYDPGDLNLDCITDIKDFAESAGKYLIDYTLTAPAEQPAEE
jgi:hypothetical protein